MREQKNNPRTGDQGKTKPARASLTAYALFYAIEWGLKILPCIEHGSHAKAPYIPGGFKNATIDPDIIEQWWTKWPGALIGAAIPEGVFVLDFDQLSIGGFEQETSLELPLTMVVKTGRDTTKKNAGYHVWLSTITDSNGHQYPESNRQLTNPETGEKLEGVDVRAPGAGYVIMPPSTHPATGRAYEWENPDPSVYPPPTAPVELLGWLKPAPTTPLPKRNYRPPDTHTGSLDGIINTVQTASEGERNKILYWAAMRLKENQASQKDWERLENAAMICGLDSREIRRTINSASRQVA